MDDALRGTRGAAATVAVVDRARSVTLVGVGNVAAAIVDASGVQRYLPQAGMIGRRHRPSSAERTFALPVGAYLALWTDGIPSDAVSHDRVVGRSAVQVAQELLTTRAKPHDDALVAIVR
jgi:hypothetical protein